MLSHRNIYKEQLFIPIELQFQTTAAVSFKVLSGVSGQLSELGDTYRSPPDARHRFRCPPLPHVSPQLAVAERGAL